MLALGAVVALAGCDTPVGNRPDAGRPTDEDAPISTREDSGTTVVDAGVDASTPACATDESSALVFDGVDDGVSMGRAAELGLARFTVEAWVRRDGDGRAAGTGVGGLSLVPIASKGRGESDGTNVDCNYAFGFFGDVLGGDFEDMAEGDNHPVIGRTTVSRGEWHHVAATYDGTTWRLYLDGALDGESAARATPRADSIQHFGLGTMLNSTGVASGRLHGALDEVRVWDRARSASEIATSRFSTITTEANLVGRWALDQGDGATMAPDTAGGIDGTITGATFAAPGAPTDHGTPPGVVVVAPAVDAVVSGASAELRVAVDGSPREVTFYVRALTEEDDFSVVVLPDTQYYTTGPTTAHPDRATHFFADQTRWVMANREAYRIAAVIHNGDIVDNGGTASQWRVADAAMSLLEAESATLPDGLPFGVAVGNHDESPNGSANSTVMFNQNFGIERFSGRSYYGGHYSDDNDENWFTFTAGGLEFVIVSLQFDTTQDAAVTAWARNVFASHPDAFGVLNSHYILTSGGNFGAQGGAIYNALADVENLQLMTCGHISAEARRSDTSASGHTIISMLADYQGRAQGGGGYLRIWEFSPMSDELTVRSYSPSADRWETDSNSEFTLSVDLSGAGGDFEEAASLAFPGDDARASVPVEAGVTYEWYAVVGDCTHEVRTPVARFTAVAP
jgi:hypothetical protein